ncbi:MAG: glycosyltransferase [Steroidobacteraceae bacterium]
MRILVAHNYYRSSSPSGEDRVFEQERQLLQDGGHVVHSVVRRNDAISDSARDRLGAALAAFWSTESYKEVRDAIDRFRPDVMHCHNLFPQLSPSILAACSDRAIPVVQTLHNFRLLCANGLLLRAGRICESCVGRSMLSGIRHACYRHSRYASAAVALSVSAHRLLGLHSDRVQKFIVLTEFALTRFLAAGLPPEKFAVRPNWVPDPGRPQTSSQEHFLFVGRLSAEKGLRTLLAAWRLLPGQQLVIIGDGPLRQELEELATQLGPHVQFRGTQPPNRVTEAMRQARALVVPSECYEGLPLVIPEAYASGVPVIAARHGAMASIVKEPTNGQTFEPGSPESLADAVRRMVGTSQYLSAIAQNNRKAYEDSFSPPAALRSLTRIYQDLLTEHRLACR